MSSEATQTQEGLTIYDVLAWLETNKKPLLVGFAAAVVVGFGIATWRWKANQTELAASDALLRLKPPTAAADQAAATDPAAYLKVAEQYPGTAAAERAILLAAGAFFTEGKYTEAEAQFSKFVRERPQSSFAPTAAYGVAACLEAEGNQDKALASYQNLSVRFPNSSVLDDAKLATARIYEAKKQPDQAFRIYEEITKGAATGMSTALTEAMARRSELLAKYPELGRTNVAAVTVPGSAASTLVTNPPGLKVATTTNAAAPATTNAAAPATTNAAAPATTNAAAPTTTNASAAKP